MTHGASSNTALLHGRQAGIKVNWLLALFFAAAMLALFHAGRLQQAHYPEPVLVERKSKFSKSFSATARGVRDPGPRSISSNRLKSVFNSFQSRIEKEFSDFNSQLNHEIDSKVRSVNLKLMSPTKAGSAVTGQARQVAVKVAPINARASRTAKVISANRNDANSNRRYAKVERNQQSAKQEDLKAENDDLIAITGAMQHQMLLSCIAKRRAASPGVQESQRWRQEAKRLCLSGISRRIALDLAAARRHPARLLSLASNKTNANRTKFIWEPRHYRKIGFDFEHTEHNYTHFVRENIIRHSAPVRANTWDDPVPIDPSIKPLKQAGVDVDAMPGLGQPEHHEWGGDGKDHFNFSFKPFAFHYASAVHPSWAFNNHALKSQASRAGARHGRAEPAVCRGSCARARAGGMSERVRVCCA
jgi:hypothetical protein